MAHDVWIVVETLRGEVMDISYVLLAAGRELADGLGCKLNALLLGSGAEKTAELLGAADAVTYVDHPLLAEFTPDAYRWTISSTLKTQTPRVVLFGHTSMGMDVASGVSLDLNAPLVASCQTVNSRDGQPWYTSLICGGKVIAEGPVPEPCCVLTMLPGGYKPEAGRRAASGAPSITRVSPPPQLDDLRIKLKTYIEPPPGDVDITKGSILVSVGRGIQTRENIELAQALADALGGVVCGSRPVVDQGWLPLSRLVGKSGKTVKPRLYMALGISGAPEHAEGMSGAETIVAVNTDPSAPIFNIAHFGIASDVLELLPVLTEKVQAAKGG